MRTSEKNGRPVPAIASPDLGASATSSSFEDLPSQTETTPVTLSRRSSVSVSDANSYYERPSPSAFNASPSRASSIISTHTKTSITTLDAPQAIDVFLGRENFRIAREGTLINISRDDTPAPPYDAPFIPAPSTAREQSEGSETGYRMMTSASDELQSAAPAYESICTTPNQGHNDTKTSPSSDHRERDDTSSQLIVYNEDETDSEPSGLVEAGGVIRSPSYNPGKENLSVSWRRTSSSSVTTEDSSGTAGGKLRRRNGVRLKLVTRSSGEGLGLDTSPLTPTSAVSSSSARSRYTQSPARTPVRNGQISETSSPTYYGNGAPGLSPIMALSTLDDRNKQLPQIRTNANTSAYLDEGFVESVPPPSMDTEDEIRTHYNRLLRTIDRNYRVELHARDEDMSKLRERINEMDQVYRSELRTRAQEMEDRLEARDKELNELRERIRVLEQNDHEAPDTARNEAEVMWELVWKDRDRHVAARMRRSE